MPNKRGSDFTKLLEQLRVLSLQLTETLPEDATEFRKKKARAALTEVYQAIHSLSDGLDPVQKPGFVFDPTDPAVAARIAGIALVAQPRRKLSSVEKSYGSGVYALYYRGSFKLYAPLSGKEHPVYVGKADPANDGSRTPEEQGVQLEKRLNEHRKTILSAEKTLNIEDFDYRSLVVRTGWEDSTEKHLIKLFRPIWNKETRICSGFGKHGDSSKTRKHPNSAWDILHSGRRWTKNNKTKSKRSPDDIAQDIRNHIEKHPPTESIEHALRMLLAQMGNSPR